MRGGVWAALCAGLMAAACANVEAAGRNAGRAPAPPVERAAPAPQTVSPAPSPAPPVAEPTPAPAPVAEGVAAPPAPAPQRQASGGSADLVVPGIVDRQVPPPSGDPRSVAERMADIRAWDACVTRAQGAAEGDPMRPQLQSPEEICTQALGMAGRNAVPISRRVPR